METGTALQGLVPPAMLSNKLTDTAIRKRKPGDRLFKLSDGGGLYLEVHTTGSRYWRMKYRFAGAEKRLAFGVYPEVTLADARRRRDEARKALADGLDPGELRKAQKAAQGAKAERERLLGEGKLLPGSFEAVAREWWVAVHSAKVSEGHAARTLTRFEQDVFPWLGARPIGEIEAPELLQCLRRVEARSAIETAHRIKDACAQVFRYGIASGGCIRNPAADLRDALKPVLTKHHAAIVDPVRAGELLRDMMVYRGSPLTRAALALSAIFLLRPGNVRQMEWSWIDLDEATLTIPSESVKGTKTDKMNRPPHLVPLAPQALAILRDELLPLTGHGRYVFPSLHTGERCMSENTVNTALRRMGYDRDTMTAHGFRAMARTMIAERLGVPTEVIEAQLTHTSREALGRAYDRTQYLEQRRGMMRRWADYLDRLREGAHVVRLASKRTDPSAGAERVDAA